MPFKFVSTDITGVRIIVPRVFVDDRGFFLESYKATDFRSEGIDATFVQDNHSKSTRGVLRGLHFQKVPNAQAKLVRVLEGAVWDVAVDLREGSPTFGRWFGTELSADNHRMLYIPPGLAHGFVTLSDTAQFFYKCSAEYNRESEAGIRWDDPTLAIEWPVTDITTSDKDRALPMLQDAYRFPEGTT